MALLISLAVARAQDETGATQSFTCPLDGNRFSVRLVVARNEGGGRDSDGCRWAVDRTGRLEVLELREIVACPKCGCALYRGHFAAAASLGRRADEAAIQSALAAAGPLDPARFDTTVARAVATYRALGHARLGIAEDPDAFEGKLWLRAAWAVRMRLVRDDERTQPLRLVFAPRSPQDAIWKLENLDLQANPDPDAPAETPVEDALTNLEQARSVLDPLDGAGPASQHLAFERVRGALDLVEQTLLVLRAKHETDRQANATRRAARQEALAVARAAHRAGEGNRRDHWVYVASQKGTPEPDITEEANRLRNWVGREDQYLALATASLARAGERATGARRSELMALAADALRRRISDTDSALIPVVKQYVKEALEGSGPGVQHAEFIRGRVGE